MSTSLQEPFDMLRLFCGRREWGKRCLAGRARLLANRTKCWWPKAVLHMPG